jgi:putative DNA primase/helicase
MTIDTHIHSLQFIADDFKKFMTGGRVKGCYFPIGSLTNQIWIAEGFATAATVFEVTGAATVCAFNAGNLPAVTEHFVEMGLQVYIAADNDKAGWEAAGKARLVGAEYRAAPDFYDGQIGTDWNDFCALYGAEQTREGLYGA